MLTDYKLWYVKREGDTPETAVITEAAVRFFEGGYELRENEAKEMVNTYVRAKRLAPEQVTYIAKIAAHVDYSTQIASLDVQKAAALANAKDDERDSIAATYDAQIEPLVVERENLDALAYDSKGNPTVVFTPKDFGAIRTDDELRKFLNGIIAADTTRTVIAEQSVDPEPDEGKVAK